MGVGGKASFRHPRKFGVPAPFAGKHQAVDGFLRMVWEPCFITMKLSAYNPSPYNILRNW
jgi:hypothetical protein